MNSFEKKLWTMLSIVELPMQQIKILNFWGCLVKVRYGTSSYILDN